MATYPHLPVLLQEILVALERLKIGRFVDGTTGAGGHAEGILHAHPEIRDYLAIDQDPLALSIARERLASFTAKITFSHQNFATVALPPADAILLDLGVSSMQLDQGERGLSFSKEGPLDMRMNPQQALTAAEIVNEWPEESLRKLLREFGEEPRYRRAAACIVAHRPFHSTKQLADILSKQLPPLHGKKIHPATLIFQALRIAVNDELGALQKALPKLFEALTSKGLLLIISFHSLEDRIVKQFFRKTSGWKGGLDKYHQEIPIANGCLVTKKPITATLEELRNNPRSRSAKLRILEKL